jgi:hypothetical protein
MTNQTRGIISLPFNGENLQLRIATNEWCELEDEHGKSTDEVAAEFFEMAQSAKLKMHLLRSFFRAALSGARPGITHGEAGAIMTEIGLVQAAEVIGKVIIASMPEVKEPGKPKAAARRQR